MSKTPITAADLLNDYVLSFYESHDLPMLRILTDRGTEFCGRVDQQDYQLYLAINDIDHTKTKAMSPQKTVSANVFTKRYYKSFIKLRSVRSCIVTLKHYNQILMNGFITIIMLELTKEKCAVDEHQ